MDYFEKIIGDIEAHDVEGIAECFKNGINPNQLFLGEPLLYELTSEYARSSEFAACVKVFAEHGLVMDDKALLAVLLDDSETLNSLLDQNPPLIDQRYTMRCSYTQMIDVSLLHICAEFNHVACAKVLLDYGLDKNVKAGADEFGFGGQTAIFHTVNQNSNASKEMMEFLLEQDVELTENVHGLIWGKGYDWETFIPSVNAISYCMMGLLPQMHRNEKTITDVVSRLVRQAYGVDYKPGNIPNKYLSS